MGRSPSVTAAAMRGRNQLRHRWRSWLVLALLVGIAGGLLFGAAAGARRTASVYDRLTEQSGRLDYGIYARPIDSEVSGCGEEEAPSVELANACRDQGEAAIRRVVRSPLVADGTVLTTMLVPVFTADGRSLQPEEGGDDPCFTGSGEVDVDSFGSGATTINRPVYTSGRAPRRRDEVAVSKGVAGRLGIGLGDELRIVPAGACDGTPKKEWPAAIPVRVVGVQLTPIEVEPEAGFFLQSVAVTPGLLDEFKRHGLGTPNGIIRVKPGVSRHELVAAAKEDGVALKIAIVGEEFAAGVEHSLGPDVTTLWVLVALGGAAVVIVLGQAIVRQVQSESADLGALRAMGFTTRDLATVGGVEGAVLGGVVAVVAVVVGLAVSPLTPIGRARNIEPDPGFRVDPLVVLGGAAVLATVCLLAVVVASWLVARRALAHRTVRSRPSLVASWTGRARLTPPAAYGVRMALEPARGSGAAPIRSGFVGMIAALAVLTGSLTFMAGLDHLVATPRLVGLNWDAMYFLEDFPGAEPDGASAPQLESALDRARGVAGVDAVDVATIFSQGGASVIEEVPNVALMSFGTGPGEIGPTLIDGRAPETDHEVLFTRQVLEQSGLEIGDRIILHGEKGQKFAIVGTGVLPFGDGRFDTAASVTLNGLRRLIPDATPEVAVVRFTPGVDRARVGNELARLGFQGGLSSREVDLLELTDLNVRPAESTPRLLAVLMAVLAAGIVVHVIVTVGRARRRELAVLRALGFTPHQVRVSTAWQATTIALVSTAGAVVIGIIGGRALWRLYADRLAVVPEPALAWAAMGTVVVAALVLCNLVAWIAGRRATHVRPAVELRAE